MTVGASPQRRRLNPSAKGALLPVLPLLPLLLLAACSTHAAPPQQRQQPVASAVWTNSLGMAFVRVPAGRFWMAALSQPTHWHASTLSSNPHALPNWPTRDRHTRCGFAALFIWANTR